MPAAEKGKTLLIVEDNKLEREGLSILLQQDGYQVIPAANGKEALERLHAQPMPDLMLLDMMMSEIDGWHLLRLLRHYPELISLPVIIVTGLGNASPEWAQSLGAAGLVRKPVDMKQLQEELTRVLNNLS
jgi:CheY-like chemotaxis protein